MYNFFNPKTEDDSDLSVRLGAVMNTISCFFNHNCDSNIGSFCSEGTNMYFYALKPIKQNEQVKQNIKVSFNYFLKLKYFSFIIHMDLHC